MAHAPDEASGRPDRFWCDSPREVRELLLGKVDDFQCSGQGFGAVFDFELTVDVLQVRLDGEWADVEARGDLLVGPALGYAQQDVRFSIGQSEEPERFP